MRLKVLKYDLTVEVNAGSRFRWKPFAILINVPL